MEKIGNFIKLLWKICCQYAVEEYHKFQQIKAEKKQILLNNQGVILQNLSKDCRITYQFLPIYFGKILGILTDGAGKNCRFRQFISRKKYKFY